MRRFLLIVSSLISSSFLHSQALSGQQALRPADDFTITTTDGITHNLYNTLDSGKTVFVDLFYTTCTWCQFYSPVIEEIYQNTGAGQGDIEFWGISNNLYDTNNVIEQYKEDYNITNPCAGPWGGGTTAFTVIVNGQNFQGFPTYCVICPDRTLYFNPIWPPTISGYNPYFESCDTLTGINNYDDGLRSGIISVYPNPASTEISMEIIVDEPVAVGFDMYNLLGMKVYSTTYELMIGKKTITINTGYLSNGVYFIKMMEKELLIDTKKAWIVR
jgi:hypothetical protein